VFTWSGWVRPRIVNVTQVLADFGENNGNGNCNELYIQNNGKIGLWNGSSGVEGATTLTAGVWKYLTVTCSGTGGTDLKAYIDGVLEISHAGVSHTASIFTIGGWPGAADYFDGDIADEKLFNVALTAKEIRQEMSSLLVMTNPTANRSCITGESLTAFLTDFAETGGAWTEAGSGAFTYAKNPPVWVGTTAKMLRSVALSPPTAGPVSLGSLAYDTNFSVTVATILAQCSASEGGSLSLTSVTPVLRCTSATINGANVDVDPEIHQSGELRFNYTITESGSSLTASSYASGTLGAEPGTIPPEANPVALGSLNHNTNFSVPIATILAQCTDGEGGNLSLTSVTPVTNCASAVINGANVDVGPLLDAEGTLRFDYLITESGSLLTDTSYASGTLLPPPPPGSDPGATTKTFNLLRSSEAVPTLRSIDPNGHVGRRPTSYFPPVFNKTVLHGTVSQTQRGTTMTKIQPVMTSATGFVRFEKVHGPDDMVVNPLTGVATWVIPGNERGEAHNMSIRAWNGAGDDLISWVEIVKATGVDVPVYLVGPTRQYPTLQAARRAMVGGGVMVIDPGVYQGDENAFGSGLTTDNKYPPGGSADQRTTVIGRHPPAKDLTAVILDGQNVRTMIYSQGNHQNAEWLALVGQNSGVVVANDFNYTKLSGLVSKDDSVGAFNVLFAQYTHAIYCYAYHNQHPSQAGTGVASFQIGWRGTWSITERCANFGFGDRYLFAPYQQSDMTFRRNFGRHGPYGEPNSPDMTNGEEPVAGCQMYHVRRLHYSNNLMIDGDIDAANFWIHMGYMDAAYGNASTTWTDWSDTISSDRNIACDWASGMVSSRQSDLPKTQYHNDMLYVDGTMVPQFGLSTLESQAVVLNTGPLNNTRHTYIMVASEKPAQGCVSLAWSQKLDYTNCIFDAGYRRANGLNGARVNDGQWFHAGYPANNAVVPGKKHTTLEHCLSHNPGGHVVVAPLSDTVDNFNPISINPYTNGLTYPMWIDEGAPLLTLGLDGAQVGAQITTYKGKLGTYYGEAGYNTETNIRCWPIPEEDILVAWARVVADYTGPTRPAGGYNTRNYGPNATISATRGSCAIGMSPTSYLCRKLGNATPQFSEIATVSGATVTICWKPLLATADRDKTVSYLVYRGDVNGNNGSLIATVGPTIFTYDDTPGVGTHSYWIIRRDTSRGFSKRVPGYFSLATVA
jgi:hypothetical protein